MQKMLAELTGDEVPKPVEITKERCYELYQQKYDTHLEVVGKLTKLKEWMTMAGDGRVGMFNALPAWIELLVWDILWRQTAGKIEWELENNSIMQHKAVMNDEERFKAMTKKFIQKNDKFLKQLRLE